MARYSSSATRAGINTANSAMFNLSNTSTASRMYVTELMVGISVAMSTAPLLSLSRATARGTQTLTLVGQAHDPADPAALGTLDSTWSVVPPVSTSAVIRHAARGGTPRGRAGWTFYDAPLVIDKTAASGLTISNVNASGATLGTLTCYAVWDE